jgi:multidrug efflux pump subunit AcrA (membrane-fusion protein)
MSNGVAAEPAKIGQSTTPRFFEGRRLYLAAGVLIVLLAAAGAAWWTAGRSGPVHYTTTPVARGAVVRVVTATGTINPVLTIIVGTYVSGVIQELYCDYNTQMKKGQICAKIDPRPYQTIVDQDKAILAVAKAQLEKDKANLEYAKVNFGRNTLLARQNLSRSMPLIRRRASTIRRRRRSWSTRRRSRSARPSLRPRR